MRAGSVTAPIRSARDWRSALPVPPARAPWPASPFLQPGLRGRTQGEVGRGEDRFGGAFALITTLVLHPEHPGLLEFTAEVAAIVARSGAPEGLCTLFLRHTSASLLIQENADPAVRRDLEA